MNDHTFTMDQQHTGPNKEDESNWRSLPWNWALIGEKVWLKGTHNGEFRAYGPYKVHNVKERQLESGTPERLGQVFRHMAEHLLVPVDPIAKGGPPCGE